MKTQLSNIEYQNYFKKGISFNEYLNNMTNEANSQIESNKSQYIPLNLHRMNRISKTIKLKEELILKLKSLPAKIKWLVISEHWCGDSSQSLSAINAVSETSDGKIELRIIYRDENPELMNAHLTNGTKSIPKLLEFDDEFNLKREWGPYPEAAGKLISELRSNPDTAASYKQKLHKWYADDKTFSTQKDLLDLLQ